MTSTKSKLVLLNLVIISLLGWVQAQPLAPQPDPFVGGDGSKSNPYEIDDCIGLQGIENSSTGTLSDNYELVSDIDCSDTKNWNSGKGFDPLGNNTASANTVYFSGEINGNNHTIEGLKVARDIKEPGMIHALNGTVKEVKFVNADIRGRGVGGVVAGRTDGGTIRHVGVYSSQVKIDDTSNAGLIVGESDEGALIETVVTSGFVNASLGAANGGAAGISGDLRGSSLINKAYSNAALEGPGSAGITSVIVGGEVRNSYFAGELSGSSSDGIVDFTSSATVSDAYWDEQKTGVSTDASGSSVPLNTSEMTGDSAVTNMSGFDFTNNWITVLSSDPDTTGDGYPILQALNRTVQLKAQGIYDPFSGGSGTSGDPYQISTCQQLQDMQNNLSANYELMNDVDCSGFTGFSSVGDSYNRFTGVLDGQNFTVENLTINEGSSDNVGLIGYLDGGEVRDIGVVDVNITGAHFTGGLVGDSYGSVSRSYSTGSVSGINDVGGLVGYMGGSVSFSFSTASVSGNSDVGGLVGATPGSDFNIGNVSSSYSTGNVSGSNYGVGGLVGDSGGNVYSSFSTGNVSGSSAVGGLVGVNGGSVSDSYWDVNSSNQSSSGGGTGLSTGEMQGSAAETNMSGLDFTVNWTTVEASDSDASSDGYPVLQVLNRTVQLKAQGIYDTPFSGGSGTSSDPYEISTCQELQDMNTDLSANYELVNDIDCSDTKNWNSGKGLNPLGITGNGFNGTFDGKGYYIRNLTIDRSSENYIALFEEIGTSGIVKNISFENGFIKGNKFVGGIAAVNKGKIQRIIINSFSAETKTYLGGIAAVNKGEILENMINGTATVTGDNAVASGIVSLNKGTLSKTYISGNITLTGSSGGKIFGGIAANNTGTVKNLYSSADAVAYNIDPMTDALGKQIGYNYNIAEDIYTLDRGRTSPLIAVNVGTVQGESKEMPSQNMSGVDAVGNMTGLDFSSTWETVKESDPKAISDGYPVLQVLNRTEQLKAQGIYSTGSGSILNSQSNINVPKGALWVQSSDLRWGNGTSEFWLKDAPIANAGSPGPSGALWIQGTELHWIDESGDERSYEGSLVQSGVSGPKGALWVQNGYIHYIDQNSDERETDGT